jgi:DNA-directed RNA polymerase subunit RPC12/RpoP
MVMFSCGMGIQTSSKTKGDNMKYTCLRCGHEWESRTTDKPKACPACKSYRWNKERETKKEEKKMEIKFGGKCKCCKGTDEKVYRDDTMLRLAGSKL